MEHCLVSFMDEQENWELQTSLTSTPKCTWLSICPKDSLMWTLHEPSRQYQLFSEQRQVNEPN